MRTRQFGQMLDVGSKSLYALAQLGVLGLAPQPLSCKPCITFSYSRISTIHLRSLLHIRWLTPSNLIASRFFNAPSRGRSILIQNSSIAGQQSWMHRLHRRARVAEVARIQAQSLLYLELLTSCQSRVLGPISWLSSMVSLLRHILLTRGQNIIYKCNV